MRAFHLPNFLPTTKRGHQGGREAEKGPCGWGAPPDTNECATPVEAETSPRSIKRPFSAENEVLTSTGVAPKKCPGGLPTHTPSDTKTHAAYKGESRCPPKLRTFSTAAIAFFRRGVPENIVLEESKGKPCFSWEYTYLRPPPGFRSMAAAENVRSLRGPGGHPGRRRKHSQNRITPCTLYFRLLVRRS